MSISVNQILEEEERKKKQAQTAPVSTPEEAVSPQTGGFVPQGAVESRTARYLQQLNRQRQELSRPEQAEVQPQQQDDNFDYSGKPAGWGDDEYRAVRQLYSDEQIQQSLANPDPQSFMDGIYSNMFKENVPPPVELDEKAMKRQRAIAGIGDALGLLSQAIGGVQGAHNQQRSFEQSAYGQLSKKQQEIYDKYRQETDQYSRELVNMQMKDYLSGMQNWKETQSNIAKSLNDYRNHQINVAKQQQDAAYKAFQIDNTDRRTTAYEKSLEQQADDRRRRTDITAARTQAYIEKLNKPVKTDTGKADYQLVLPAHVLDQEASIDQFGNPVRVFGMSNGEMDQYARQALADADFLSRYPEYTPIHGVKHTADEKRTIAAKYLQEMYASQFGGATTNNPGILAGAIQGAQQLAPVQEQSTAQEVIPPPVDEQEVNIHDVIQHPEDPDLDMWEEYEF